MQLQDSTAEYEVRQRGERPSLWEATARVVLLLAALVWWLSVLPRVMTTESAVYVDTSAAVIRPGTVSVPDERVETSGDWVVQTVGDNRFLATRSLDDRLRFRFVGTSLALTVRVGPDAGPVRVRIRHDAADISSAHDMEVTLDFERSVTRVVTVPVAEDLEPGVHTVEIRNIGATELAVSTIVVGGEPGIWWAWVGPVVVGLLALVSALVRWWRALAHALGWTLGSTLP
ncbi:hypothetical protein OO015_00995 [Thermomicrobium sp. 4228-Ro]|uniref:hypothetical protein n=1 Tax=Thermomicrobium sp. 4228-Ro TaxID=2993937 RepID=UPI002248D8A7|nr:hypothetical protein [Thermomicrobium sp. 4228-Ro]MCX2726080.1 hypothetical protein [Thermomicrobium sp. 4228-Ro]